MAKAAKPVALVTGVSGGIGLATARAFAARGWIVVGTVRGRSRPAALRGAALDLQAADMLKPRDLERVVKTAWRTYGRLDALVCNAGYGLLGSIDTLDYAQMEEEIKVNVVAQAELARQVVPLMRRQRSGVIIGMSSMAGRMGFSGYSLYSASKYALEGLFEALHMELAPSGVRVKLIEPSSVETSFWTNLQYGRGQQSGVDHGFGSGHGKGLPASAVAATVVRAALDRSNRLRYPLGQTRLLNLGRRVLPERWFLRLMRRIVTGN